MVEAGRALARHHKRGLAGERRVQHLARLIGRKPKFIDRVFDDRGLADAGIAEHAADLLLLGAVGVPVLDGRDRGALLVGECNGHAAAPTMRWQRRRYGQNRHT